MKRTALLLPFTLGLVVALAPGLPRPAPACSPAFREGASVRIANESVLIIWDAEAKKQHFIRRITFDTETPDFGFLVPTPTEPYVTEAPNEVFANLEEWTKPEVITRQVRRPPPGSKVAGRAMMPTAEAPPVRVVNTGRVGNLEYKILQATDPKALTEWLGKNGYATRPALTEWFKWYTDNEWLITAFKIAKDEGANRAAPKAVRMSFDTDRPFHPYREPADLRKKGASHPPRLMRVFFIGPERVKGRVGLDGAWTGRTVWADQLQPAQANLIGARLELANTNLPLTPWLTVFEDTASPRPGTDEVYFEATEPDVVKRPPVENIVYVDDAMMPGGGPILGKGPLTVTIAAVLFVGVVLVLGLVILAWWLTAQRAAPRG
jgi:hypothetical protein